MGRKHSKGVNGSLLDDANSNAALKNYATDGKIAEANESEFDDLISALRTGDVFGEDNVAKIKRSRRSKPSPIDRDEARERKLNGVAC